MSKLIDNIYLGPLPNRVIFALVSTKAYDGDYKLNPFNFHHYDLSEISVLFDNQPLSGFPLKMDYEKSKFAAAYNTLFTGTGRNYSDSGCGIKLADYPNGFCIYSFDLTPDQSSSAPYWTVQKTGNMSINLRFNKELPENVTAIIYSEFDNLLEIDKYRNIIIDYPA
jgi:hypothetical protein